MDASARYFSDRAAGYRGGLAGHLFEPVRRHEARAITELLGPVSGRAALELGCGAGHYALHMQRAGATVTAIDRVPAMVDQARRAGIDAHVGTAEAVDLGRTFPVLLCAGVLEFVDDPAAVLHNAARHADPGATFVLLVPRDGWPGRAYRAWHRGHGVQVRLFDAPALDALARTTGWSLERTRRAGLFALVARLVRS